MAWKWQPTPVFLSGKSHGQRSLAGYSAWGQKELDSTEHTHTLCDFAQGPTGEMCEVSVQTLIVRL